MPTQIDNRQVVQRAVLPMLGNAANEQLSVLFPRIDAEMAKLFEDRNILMTDGGTITFTGTQVQFTENLNITLNQKISGAVPQVISLGSANQNFASSGDMWVAVLNRTAGTATTSIITAGNPLPAAASANQEVFLIAKRVDAGDGTQRLYWRNGFAMNAGQTLRLGQGGGSGSGSGTGDDLDALLFRASFLDTFQENAANANSSIDGTSVHTNALFNAAKNMYAISYDASKTVTGSSVNMTLSGTPSFTVVAGDVLVVGTEARKIVTVTSQTVYVLESAFTVTPSPVAAAATVTQAVYTKDIYNLAVDGAALSAAFPASTFAEFMVDYKDNASAGSNLFTPDVAPVVAFTATNDNTNFTLIQTRATNITDQFQSDTLPSSGSNLFIRFFSNKTSGTGVVNLLMYKAFMQKSTVATAGGITNSAYAFTNGIGTPINCAVSLVGGKTTLTLTWQYATGVYSGTTASAIEVWLNGQKLPRFVNSTLTPDGSFLETSSSIITLDRDYSSVNLSVEVYQRTQIVDNSTVNTTAISYQQEIMQNGFQAFVAQNQLMNATSVAGTPQPGTFYSSVQNRASMVDLTQDLKVRMGIERIPIQQIIQIISEAGPSNEYVWGLPNDLFGQIRFVGLWANNFGAPGTSGAYAQSSNNSTDFMEVTFYGTGLNLLTLNNAAYNAVASTDGGAEGANIYLATGSTVLASRNYSANTVINVVSGLTLGIHTVKIRSNNGAGSAMVVQGIEILTETAGLRIPPGVSYAVGQKLVNSSLQTPAHNTTFETGTLGSRGGRVLVYQKADGTIAKALIPTGSQLNFASTDHSNEDVARVYSFREFGAGRSADDFSTVVPGSTGARAFTLDDGTTALTCSGGFIAAASGTTPEVFGGNAAADTLSFTFVGTGLDVVQETAIASITTSSDLFKIDNVTTLTSTSGSGLSKGTVKVVSGLPYGVHTFTYVRGTGVTGPGFSKFIVYQPKKPTLPSGATELADYNLMATYVAASNILAPPVGTLFKTPIREMNYVGTWTASSVSIAGLPQGGWFVSSTTVGNYVEYTFFGTGIEIYATGNPTSASCTIQIDGVAYTGAATTINTGTWTPGSSTWALGIGSQLQISGLTLGLHRVRATISAVNTSLQFFGMYPITPIHVHKSNTPSDLQNTLLIGSQGVSDNRKITPVKDILPANKAWAQAVGVTSAPTTTSTSFVPLTDMSLTLKTSGGRVKLTFVGQMSNGTTGSTSIQFYVDGIPVGIVGTEVTSAATNNQQLSLEFSIPLSAGTHKFDVYWLVSTGTSTSSATNRILTVEEA